MMSSEVEKKLRHRSLWVNTSEKCQAAYSPIFTESEPESLQKIISVMKLLRSFERY